MLQEDECFILIKALPHRSSNYFETVCCGGIGRDGNWRRQYPVPFRVLADSQKFGRWDWIKYRFRTSEIDKRRESQKVDPESFEVTGKLARRERARFLNPLIRNSFSDADQRGDSLTLLRPVCLELDWEDKSLSELENEREKHAQLANQLSLFDQETEPLEPCPVRFFLNWQDQEGKTRRHVCDDWETSTAFTRFERSQGKHDAIDTLRRKYCEEYFKSGLALAFSTHSRRNVTNGISNQWLLVGLIRIDHEEQKDLFLSQ